MGELIAVRTARRLALAAAAGAALFAAAEAGLRLAHVGAPAWYRPDPVLGWALRAYAGSHGGARYGEVNAFGQRDNLHSPDKRPGVYRIAVLGDELSEALDVPQRDAWWHRLPAELDRCGFAGGRKIEVLNFGVGGYSTAQESIVLETAVVRYHPDLVLLQLATGKDVRENSRALATRLDRPFYALDGQGGLRLDASFLEQRDFAARSQFRYELAREIRDRSRVLQALARLTVMTSAHAEAPEPRDARWQEAWRVTEALLARMSEFAGRNGARFAVFAAPGADENEREARAADARLFAFGASRGIPYGSIAWPSPRSPDGHRVAAQRAAAGLCRAMP
jgi:hypothetical protein